MVSPKIQEVRESVLSYLELIRTMLHQTIEGSKAEDWDRVKGVIEVHEPRANALKLEIALNCLGVLALFHPEASHLRAIVKMSGMASDLERMGDMATKIARANYYWRESFHISQYPIILEMYEEVLAMLRDTSACLLSEDALSAVAVIQRDDIVDELCTKNLKKLIKKMSEGGEEIEAYIQLMNITRNLERMADLCGHLAEDIIFIKEGALPRS